MTPRTHTVTGGYTDREGRIWVYVRGNPTPLRAEKPFRDGAAVKVQGGRAVAP